MNEIRDKLAQKQAEIIQLKNKEHESAFYIESQQSKIDMQDKLIKQLEAQSGEDLGRL